MHHIRRFTFVIGLLLLAAAFGIIVEQLLRNEKPAEIPVKTAARLTLTSPAFMKDGSVPVLYSCKGDNTSPPLTIESKVQNVKSYAIIMHDPDATNGDFVHWIAWNIPGTTHSIMTNTLPAEAVSGFNSSGESGYNGPCPPTGAGVHHYIFELYALDASLDIPKTSNRDALMLAMNGKLLQRADLAGTFQIK